MNFKRKALTACAVVLVLMMALATTVFAAGDSQPTISISNPNPKPGEQFTVTVNHSNTAIDSTSVTTSGPITWVSTSATLGQSANFAELAGNPVVITYTVAADAAPGTAFTVTVANMTGTDDGNTLYPYANLNTGGEVFTEPDPQPQPQPDPQPQPQPQPQPAPAPATTPIAPRTGVYA